MRIFVVIFCLITLSLSVELDTYKDYLVYAVKNHYKTVSDYANSIGVKQLDKQWLEFKTKFNRKYSSESEDERKFYFLKSLQFIKSHKKLFENSNTSHEVAINEFADWSPEEFKSIQTSIPIKLNEEVIQYDSEIVTEILPTIFDWRQYNKVTPVKNQGRCGSCWAFATIATIESAFLIKLNESLDLSEQQLVDCCNQNSKYMCFGCGGGWLPQAMKYLQEFGIEYENDYNYVGKDEKCKNNPTRLHMMIRGFNEILHSTDEQIMNTILTNGPVAVFIDSMGDDFKFYHGGIMKNEGHHSADHYVTVVGWGPDYWIVKNSWGLTWGEQGYFRIAKGNNLRGINNRIVYPIV